MVQSKETGKLLDVITIGRSSIDLYGGQVGGRLEDMASFQKYIGGSPTNIAAGAARLGLRAALITRVGDEHLGRFIREQLEKEGVDTRGVKTDPERLTALAILGIRDDNNFPMIFYRENCADMALSEADIDPDLIAEASCVCATGTHLSNPRTEAAVLKALNIARDLGVATALDIDYRPTLWGLAGHGEAASRYVASELVTKKMQSALGSFDLIVGTEEEFHIAGGNTDTIAALREVRRTTSAALVCKLGPMGAVVFDGEIPDSLEDGVFHKGFDVEVFNVLGAGDGFMAGLLKGWLTGSDWRTALLIANACGALAVSRHGCAPSYPSEQELEHFLTKGTSTRALRKDGQLEQIHWSTTRPAGTESLRVFAFDHRGEFENCAGEKKVARAAISEFKDICLESALRVANRRSGYGVICDSMYGRRALYDAAETGLWIARPTEVPGTRPLEYDPELGPDLGALAEWPLTHVAKVLCFCHPRDPNNMWHPQRSALEKLAASARRNRLELLLELVSSTNGRFRSRSLVKMVEKIYDVGIYPDWWRLEPMKSEKAWESVCGMISSRDPNCRGILVIGLDSSPAELFACFESAAKHELVKGFAVGRTIFKDAANSWFRGEIDSDAARKEMTRRFGDLCRQWDRCCAKTSISYERRR